MNSSDLFKYLVFSLIPLFFSKAAVFVANIISAKQLSLDDFALLSGVYISAAMLATPVVSTFNHYVSVFGGQLKSIVINALIAAVVVGILCSIYFYFSIEGFTNITTVSLPLLVGFVIVLSGALNAILLGSKNGPKANFANSVGVVLFLFLSFFILKYDSSWEYFVLLYISIPLAVLLINSVLIGHDKSIISNLALSRKQKSSSFYQLFVITICGAPIQLAVISAMNMLDPSGYEIAYLNIAYQWHILVVILPTMFSTVLMKLLATGDRKAMFIYKRASLYISFGMAAIVFVFSFYSSELYGEQFSSLFLPINLFGLAGVCSVIYHLKLNECISQKCLSTGVKLATCNGLIYLLLSLLCLTIVPSASTLACCMMISYILTTIIFHFFGRVKSAS